MEQELIDFIVENGTKQVIEQEPVSGGFRPLIVHYEWEHQIVIETHNYTHPASSPYWLSADVSRELQIETGFKAVEI